MSALNPAPPADLVNAFLEAASVPLDSHASGSLDEASKILTAYPHLAGAGIYTAAVLGDEAAVRAWLAQDAESATRKGGPREWDALTYLCFSRYLRLDPNRAEAFVRAARLLLAGGATANTGWITMIDHPHPRPLFESAIYAAAGIAQHPGLTQLLLEHGADPNDEETPYHVAETHDNTVLKILLRSGKLNSRSLSTLLLRKCDWHDPEGVRLVLEHGADPNRMTIWGHAALHQAIRRDNSLDIVECLLDYNADPSLPNRDGNSAASLAARRGRADVLSLFERRGTALSLHGIDALLAASARDSPETVHSLLQAEPHLKAQLLAHAGTLLAQFASTGNLAGVRNLLDLGISPAERYREGDGYFGVAQNSTALHVAAWRAWPEVVQELIGRGAPVDAKDAWGRTPLQLAVKACIDSYWIARRSPGSVRALLRAGASTAGIRMPTGYDEIDTLLNGVLS